MRLFLRDVNWENDTITLGRDIKKRLIKVMRMRIGDKLQIASPKHGWECQLDAILPDAVVVRKISELPAPSEAGLRLILGQAIPKGDRFEWLIQKATELGISEIYPLITERTIVRPENTDKKLQRWNEISVHAAEQSESNNPCAIWPPETVKSFLQHDFRGLNLMLHEREGSKTLKDIIRSYYDIGSITFVVGPEGGWAPEETKAFEEAQFHKVHLGPRILRSETAGLALAAIIQYELNLF